MAAVNEHTGRALTESEREWLRVRSYLKEHRHELGGSAVAEFIYTTRVAGTPLLSRPEWIPAEPLPLDAVHLDFRPDAPIQGVDGGGTTTAKSVLPIRADGTRYPNYSATMAALGAPAVFENRPTYRLLEADLSRPRARLVFGRGCYFDSIDTGEAAAHEYAAAQIVGRRAADGLRAAIGDPTDLTRRPVNLAISTLSIRRDLTADASTFLLHWRDPAKVGHAGGLYQVIPVGVFQPSADGLTNERNDFDLWRCIVREYAEELLGESEDHAGVGSPIDYDQWPIAARLQRAVRDGRVRAYCLGLGVDPLTFATDLLTAVVIDAEVFDETFRDAVHHNSEGQLVNWRPGLVGHPFTGELIERYARHEPIQAAGAALLRIAQDSRSVLLP